MLILALAPTAPGPAGLALALAPGGAWGLRFADDIELRLRIERGAGPAGYRVRGRQAYFDDPLYARFDAQGYPPATDALAAPGTRVRRAGTLNGLAATVGQPAKVARGIPHILLAAGYRLSDRMAAASSGLGPDGARTGPDHAAPSETSRVRPYVRTIGNASGSRSVMSGTSAAAPQLARWIAETLSGSTTHRPSTPSGDPAGLGKCLIDPLPPVPSVLSLVP